MSNEYIHTKKIFDAVSISTSGDDTSDAIDLNLIKPEGYFSLHVIMTGLGTAKIEYLLSNDGANYLTPASASDIVTAHTAGSDIFSFAPEMARYMKIKVTEAGVNNIVITIILAIQ